MTECDYGHTAPRVYGYALHQDNGNITILYLCEDHWKVQHDYEKENLRKLYEYPQLAAEEDELLNDKLYQEEILERCNCDLHGDGHNE